MRTLLSPLLNSGDIDYYSDLYWSGVGPHHERASYNLLYLVDAYTTNRGARSSDPGAPYRACSSWGFGKRREIEPREYPTIEEAKCAGRTWFAEWLATTGSPIEWCASRTGVHFIATADGLDIGSYYFNPRKTDHWHKGFRGHFGMTYYREDIVRTPEEAKAAVAETWAEWLRRARERFLVNVADEPRP